MALPDSLTVWGLLSSRSRVSLRTQGRIHTDLIDAQRDLIAVLFLPRGSCPPRSHGFSSAGVTPLHHRQPTSHAWQGSTVGCGIDPDTGQVRGNLLDQWVACSPGWRRGTRCTCCVGLLPWVEAPAVMVIDDSHQKSNCENNRGDIRCRLHCLHCRRWLRQQEP